MRRIPPVSALLFCAAAINFSWIQELHDSDTLLMPLISIDRYTPFYWGDNRYGMLVPLLASWIRDYQANLLFQTQILVLAAIGTVVLFHAFLRSGADGLTERNLASACLSIGIIMLLVRPTFRVAQVFFLAHPYFISLVTGLTGVVLLLRVPKSTPRLRYAGAILSFALSMWINTSNAPLFLGLILLLPSREGKWKGLTRDRTAGTILLATALIVVTLFARQYPSLGGAGLAPLSQYPQTFSRMWVNFWSFILFPGRTAVFAGACLLIALIASGGSITRMARRYSSECVVAALAGALLLFITATDWLAKNAYEPRYWTAPMAMLVITTGAILGTSIYDKFSKTTAVPVATAACTLLLIGFSVSAFGLPSWQAARVAIDQVSGRYAGRFAQLRCTHILGSYALGWSTVFYYRSHQLQPLWTISSRSEVTQDLWSRVPEKERRYCGVCGDQMNSYFQTHFRLGPIQEVERQNELCVYRPAP
jgi:hypothetical protein